MQIKNFTVTADTRINGCGAPVHPYSYVVEFSYAQDDDVFNAQWEYEITEGRQVTLAMPYFTTGYKLSGGSVRMVDTVFTERGLPSSGQYGYRARVHATSPSDAYSNWIYVPMVPC